MGAKRTRGGPSARPSRGLAYSERRRRVDLAADQLLLRLVDGVLDICRDVGGERREQLGVGEVLDPEEAVRPALEGAVLRPT